MGQYNLRVKIDTVKELLAKGNGTFQFQDLYVALGSHMKRARYAVCEARRAGTQLFAIREADGSRGAGRIVAYTTDAAKATAKKVVAPKPAKAAKPAKVKAPKAEKKAKVDTKTVKALVAETVATVEAAAVTAPATAPVQAEAAPKMKTMSIDQVRAALAARKPKVA